MYVRNFFCSNPTLIPRGCHTLSQLPPDQEAIHRLEPDWYCFPTDFEERQQKAVQETAEYWEKLKANQSKSYDSDSGDSYLDEDHILVTTEEDYHKDVSRLAIDPNVFWDFSAIVPKTPWQSIGVDALVVSWTGVASVRPPTHS